MSPPNEYKAGKACVAIYQNRRDGRKSKNKSKSKGEAGEGKTLG